MRISFSVALTLIGTTALAQGRPAVFDDAVRAMGGEAAIRAATSLTLEGTGRTYNFGQGMSPSVALPRFDVTDFRRTIDLSAVRHHQELTRTPTFVTGVTAPQRLVA